MAEFRSKASEGSFSANQLEAPDTVGKLQDAASRRLKGMGEAQTQLEQTRSMFLQAQQMAQNLTNKGAETVDRLSRANAETRKSNSAAIWELELKENENRAKERAATFKQLTDFSKTAFSLTQDILKKNQDDFRKAKTQVAVKNGFDIDTVKAVSKLDRDMTFSAFQQSSLAQSWLKEGKSLDFIQNAYDHLYKGSGYVNYVEEAAVLKKQAEKLMPQMLAIANNTELTPEQALRQLNQLEASSLAGLTVNGQDPRAEFITKNYSPGLKQAKDQATTIINARNRQQIADRTKITQVTAVRNAYNPGDGVKRPGEAVAMIALNPSADTRQTMVTAVAMDPQTTIGDLETLLKQPFEVNGQTRTLRDYPNEAQIIENRINQLEQKEEQAEVNRKEEIDLANTVQLEQLFDANADNWTQEKQDALRNQEEQLRGLDGGTPTSDKTQRFVIETLAAEEFEKRFTKRIEAGTATMQQLEDADLPYALEVKLRSKLATIANLQAGPEYKEALKRVKDSVTNAPGLNFDIGKGANASVNWKIGESQAEFKRLVSLYSITNPDKNAVQMALDTVIERNERELKADGAIAGGRIRQYDTYMSKDAAARAKAKEERIEITALAANTARRADPKEWAAILDNERVLKEMLDYQATGNSEYLSAIGAQLTPGSPQAPWEVIRFLAPAIDGLEEVDAPQGWDQMVEFMDDEDRYVLFSTGERASPSETKLRRLQQIRLRQNARTNQEMPVRGVFGENEGVQTTWEKIALQSGFSESEAKIMAAIVMAESGGDALIDTVKSGLDPSKLNEYSIGGPQINVQAHQDLLKARGFTEEDMRDPVKAMIIAKDVYDIQGFGAWSTYNKGLHEAFFNQASTVETGQNTGIQITSANDASGEPGSDFVISGGQRGAKFHFPFKSKVVAVERNQNWETNLENNPNGERGYGNYVDVETDFGNGIVADARIAHFDDVANLSVGQQIPAGAFLGTQGRTGSTTGAHISIDWYYPGTNKPYPEARDYFLNNYLRKN